MTGENSPASTESVFERSLDASFRKFRGKLFVVNGHHALELNETAEFLIRGVDGTRSVGELARALATEFSVSVEEAEQDTLELLAELAGIGVISPAEAAARPEAP